jgi:hypothetical protein
LASVDAMPFLKAALLASPLRSRLVLMLCLPALQLPPHWGLSTQGVGVAAIVFFAVAT